MIYIDFDGVILDTELLLFEEWRKNPDRFSLPESVKIEYMNNSNWKYIIENSEVISDSIYYLKHSDPTKTCILTKIHSMENEGRAKLDWKKKNNIKQPMILVPYYCKKSEVVDPRGNILIDDCLRNLDDWIEQGGLGIFFDMDDDNYDSWQQPNIKQYKKVNNLKSIIKD